MVRKCLIGSLQQQHSCAARNVSYRVAQPAYNGVVFNSFLPGVNCNTTFAEIKASTKEDRGKDTHLCQNTFPKTLCKKVKDSTAHTEVNFTAPGTVGTAGDCKCVPASQLEVLNAGPVY
jgi:hypothetical protein